MRITPNFKQADKRGHFWLGFIVAFLVAGFCFMLSPLAQLGAGFAAGVVVGAAKEGLDAFDNWSRARKGLKARHTVDRLDFTATAIGGFFGAMTVSFWCLLLV